MVTKLRLQRINFILNKIYILTSYANLTTTICFYLIFLFDFIFFWVVLRTLDLENPHLLCFSIHIGTFNILSRFYHSPVTNHLQLFIALFHIIFFFIDHSNIQPINLMQYKSHLPHTGNRSTSFHDHKSSSQFPTHKKNITIKISPE